MMKKILAGLACAAAFGAAPVTQAAVVTFNNPGIVEVDNTTNIATYTEAGLKISGDAASFLPIDGIGVDSSGALVVQPYSTLRLFVDSGTFDLLSASLGVFDAFGAGAMGTVNIVGGGMTSMISLAQLTSFSFAGYTNLQQVTFTSDVAFILDNINFEANGAAVPEPASLGLAGVALAGLMAARRRRHRAAA